MSSSTVQVILPCLDEEQALPGVLLSLPDGFEAIVVDNGSTDRSAAIAREFGARIVAEPRRGYGAAVHAGLLAATAEIVVVCDADGTFEMAQLAAVVAPVREGGADLVLGCRRPVTRRAWPAHARLANAMLTARLRYLTGLTLHDLGPMRAARRESLLGLGLQDRRSGYPLEVVIRAAADGWRIREVDVDYRPRSGRSKVTGTVRGTLTAISDMSRQLAQVSR